jgi:exopolysaccharide biosynthesis polyprenyl glycosylphosphotransferase
MDLNRTMIVLDIVATTVVFFAAFWMRCLFVEDQDFDLFSHAALLPLILALMIFFLANNKGYNHPRRTSVYAYCWAILKSITLTVGLLLAILFALKMKEISRFIIGIFANLDFFVLIAIRIIIKSHVARNIKLGKNFKYVLIIGTGNRAKQLYQGLRNNVDFGLNIIGCLDIDEDRVGSKMKETAIIGTVNEISAVLKNNIVDEVILAVPRSMFHKVENIVYACEEEGIKISIMADLYDLQVARISLQMVGNLPLLSLEPVALSENKLAIKRAIDLAISGLSLIALMPIIALIALVIKFDSPGPVFFVQERVGLKKRRFKMFKFRSMICGAEKKLQEIEHLNEAEGPIFKMANDPRVTRVGKFLRKTSLDELPQLFNVFMGEMSLVGPRPMSIRDVDLFDKGIQRKRFSVKPGVTCLWQISGRSNLSFSKWLELDLKYIEDWSLLLDVLILIRTVPVVIKGNGAV